MNTRRWALRVHPSAFVVRNDRHDPYAAAPRSRSDHAGVALKLAPGAELIWASPRELLNDFQADVIGCHIITVTNDILKKLSLVGKDLGDYSLGTVKMFFDDGRQAGFTL